jgi:hypothetical protein
MKFILFSFKKAPSNIALLTLAVYEVLEENVGKAAGEP